jgi:Leucine-rich repeat (LRR) protein
VFLSYNRITDIPKNAFVNNKNLKVLTIGFNNLTVIHGDSFGENNNFEKLYAVNNQIRAIDGNIFLDTTLSYVELEGNVCANVNVDGFGEIKSDLATCIANYKAREE